MSEELTEGIKQKRDRWAIMRLAREYVVDFDLRKAAARAEMPLPRAVQLERSDLFCVAIQELIDTIEPEAVATRTEILMALKKEAFDNGPNSSATARIAALKELARLMGMDLPTKHEINAGQPVINLTIQQAPSRAEVTVAEARVSVHSPQLVGGNAE